MTVGETNIQEKLFEVPLELPEAEVFPKTMEDAELRDKLILEISETFISDFGVLLQSNSPSLVSDAFLNADHEVIHRDSMTKEEIASVCSVVVEANSPQNAIWQLQNRFVNAFAGGSETEVWTYEIRNGELQNFHFTRTGEKPQTAEEQLELSLLGSILLTESLQHGRAPKNVSRTAAELLSTFQLGLKEYFMNPVVNTLRPGYCEPFRVLLDRVDNKEEYLRFIEIGKEHGAMFLETNSFSSTSFIN